MVNSGVRASRLANNISSHTQCEDCDVCNQLPLYYNCRVRFVVYSLKCTLCNEEYIGETAVWLRDRYAQHRRSVDHHDSKSALSQQLVSCHADHVPNINLFSVCLKKI